MELKELGALLKKREFVSVGTSSLDGRPNSAPKFLLKAEGDRLYLVDYTIGTTWRNLRTNPLASISFIDYKTLKGYQLNGPVRIIDKGPDYKKLFGEMQERVIKLTTQHIVESVRGVAEHDNFELEIPEKFVIFEVKVQSVAEIGIKGDLKRRSVEPDAAS